MAQEGTLKTDLCQKRPHLRHKTAAGSVFNSALLMKIADILGNSQKLTYICTN